VSFAFVFLLFGLPSKYVLSLILACDIFASMGPRNAYKVMLDNTVSLIVCVRMNHQNQLEQMTNGTMFATNILSRCASMIVLVWAETPILKSFAPIANLIKMLLYEKYKHKQRLQERKCGNVH
jgi:hypothetical protein